MTEPTTTRARSPVARVVVAPVYVAVWAGIVSAAGVYLAYDQPRVLAALFVLWAVPLITWSVIARR